MDHYDYLCNYKGIVSYCYDVPNGMCFLFNHVVNLEWLPRWNNLKT
jgi:hypothetical protein